MNLFLLNLVLALAFTTQLPPLRPSTFAAGWAIGFACLWLAQPASAACQRYVRTLPKVFLYLMYVLWELLVSSLRVARVVMTPRPKLSPGVVAVPVRLKSDGAILLLANSITLTPGTLSLLVSEDRTQLFVHGMFIDDPAQAKKDITDGFERRIKEFMD